MRRSSLSRQVRRTRALLLFIWGGMLLGLFLWHLLFINQLASNGYYLSRLEEQHSQLKMTLQSLEFFSSSRQTQEFVNRQTEQAVIMVQAPVTEFVFEELIPLRAEIESTTIQREG